MREVSTMSEPQPKITPAAPLLSVQNITKDYAGHDRASTRVLHGVSIDLTAGRFVAIMGPSGSGKTTLMRCAAGLEVPTTGDVRLLDWPLSQLSDTRRTLVRRQHAAFVFQDYTLLPTLDVWHNVAVTHLIARRPPPKKRIATVLESLGLAAHHRAYPEKLSGGQQQRVAIARALVADADVIFADEPTGALDLASARAVLTALRATLDADRAILMVTHDPVAASFADDVVIMVDGRLAARLEHPHPDQVSATLLTLSRRTS
jgi:putative ABC transport system ATP-binding protein